MKIIDPKAITVEKTVCPFCSFGCEFGVVFDDFGVKGVEYIKEGNTDGRLCPRGSAAAFYLNHPQRLCVPTKGGRAVTWPKAIKDLKKATAMPQNTVVTFDRNITIEEYEAIVGFCRELGIEHIASTYFEPEALLRKFIDLDRPFALEQIEKSQMIIVLGDLFNYVPMISKTLINWKLKNRKNRLVVIDSINSHTAGFATNFLKVKPGAEPLWLFGMAQEKLSGAASAEVVDSLAGEIGQSFKSAPHGVVLAVLPFAHTYDPVLLSEGLTRFGAFSEKRIIPFFEYAGFDGNCHFGSVLESIKKGEVKNLINFGEFFPYYYPQLHKTLKPLNIFATATLKYDGDNALPVALNLEKRGTILTSFGKVSLAGNIVPVSGAKEITDILTLVNGSTARSKGLQAPPIKIDIKQRIQELAEKITAPRKKKFTLLGENIAYYFRGFFEKGPVKINPADCAELGLRPHDEVIIESKHGKLGCAIRPTNDIDQGFVAVPAETIETRGLFDFELDNDAINFIPTEVELWRKE